MELIKVSQEEVEVKLEKHLGLSNSNNLKKQLLEAANQGVKRVRLNFEETVEIDSSGLGKILFFSEYFRQRGGLLKLVKVYEEELRDLFQLIQLERLVDIEYK